MNAALKKLDSILKELPKDKQEAVIYFADYLRYRLVEEAGLTAEIVEGIKQVKAKKYRPARELLHDLQN